jgi:hypothetical protein
MLIFKLNTKHFNILKHKKISQANKRLNKKSCNMIIVLLITIFLFAGLFFTKKTVWQSSKGQTQVSLNESLFCWFTSKDFVQNAQNRWVYAFSNLTNVLLLVCFMVILASCAILVLSLA